MARLYATYKDGDQTRFVPLAVTLDADGLGILKVDTEISIDGASLNIDNLFVASTDGTPGNARYIKVSENGCLSVEGCFVSDGQPKHYNGVTNITPADTVTFANETKHIQVHALDKTLYVSFDNGVNWKTIPEGCILDLDAVANSLKIKAIASNVDYEILTLE